jgi:MarR family transcriptional regulator, organic hydroperoxide resistance regulator
VEEPVDQFRRAYWAVVHRLDTLRLRTWEEHGLSLPKLRLLFLLRARPGVNAQTLVGELGITAATVSELVEKLVRAGLVERGRQHDDRRRIPLALTAAGQAIVGEISVGNRAYLADVAALLDGDLAPVTAALERLDAAMGQRPAPVASPPSGASS